MLWYQHNDVLHTRLYGRVGPEALPRVCVPNYHDLVMAEVVGAVASAITIASVFKLCIEAFDIVQAIQTQALDFKKLTLKLNIEKCRLYIWGQAMGLTSDTEPTEQGPLELCPYPELVLQTMDLILELFRDSQRLRDKYGCACIENPEKPTAAANRLHSTVIQQLNASFDNFRTRSNVSAQRVPIARRTYWVIRDRNKFGALVHEAKALIDGLQDITKHVRSRIAQDEIVSSRIRRINDVRTLDWVSEVCEVDYPAFSDAASARAETISEIDTFHRDIQDWKDTVALEDDEDNSDTLSERTTIAGFEDMTVTELKHKLSSYLIRAKEARLQKKVPQGDNESSWKVSGTKSATTDEPPISEAEMAFNNQLLSEMAEALADQDFMAEQAGVMKWFSVLNPAEKHVIYYGVSEHFFTESYRTRLFSRIQNYRLSSTATTIPGNRTDHSKPKSNEVPAPSPRPEKTNKQFVQSFPAGQSRLPYLEDSSECSPIDAEHDLFKKTSTQFGRFARAQKEHFSELTTAKQQNQKAQMTRELRAFSRELQTWPVFTRSDQVRRG